MAGPDSNGTMTSLKGPYPSVGGNGICSYGGNQNWAEDRRMRDCGCGVIAGMDLLLYLHRNRPGCRTTLFSRLPEQRPVPVAMYNRVLDVLRKRYFPLIPGVGLNCFLLTAGLNRYFRAYGIPLRAGWGTSNRRLWSTVQGMLKADLPVILCVGHNFPLVWQTNGVNLYEKKTAGDYQRVSSAKAHYVTVTGMDKRWLRISSWGKEYYIDRAEYSRYVKQYSSLLLSNIVYLKPDRSAQSSV